MLELSTGMRRGEILGLQWKDLDEKTGELRIERQISRINGKLTAVPPKTKQSIRSIILPMPLVEVLTVPVLTVNGASVAAKAWIGSIDTNIMTAINSAANF